MKTSLLLFTSILFLSGCRSNTPSNNSIAQKNILWIWDRPTDLRFIDSDTLEFAMLSKTILLSESHIEIIQRHGSVQIPPQSLLFPVIRIETKKDIKVPNRKITKEVIEKICSEIEQFPKARRLQIDFDAKKSELNWYRNVLIEIRKRLPSNYVLSITALVSWCYENQWLESLPVDEIVPMVFQMGYNGEKIKQEFQNKSPFQETNLKYSLGCSIDEPLSIVTRTRRMYFFNPTSWTKESTAMISKFY